MKKRKTDLGAVTSLDRNELNYPNTQKVNADKHLLVNHCALNSENMKNIGPKDAERQKRKFNNLGNSNLNKH